MKQPPERRDNWATLTGVRQTKNQNAYGSKPRTGPALAITHLVAPIGQSVRGPCSAKTYKFLQFGLQHLQHPRSIARYSSKGKKTQSNVNAKAALSATFHSHRQYCEEVRLALRRTSRNPRASAFLHPQANADAVPGQGNPFAQMTFLVDAQTNHFAGGTLNSSQNYAIQGIHRVLDGPARPRCQGLADY